LNVTQSQQRVLRLDTVVLVSPLDVAWQATVASRVLQTAAIFSDSAVSTTVSTVFTVTTLAR